MANKNKYLFNIYHVSDAFTFSCLMVWVTLLPHFTEENLRQRGHRAGTEYKQNSLTPEVGLLVPTFQIGWQLDYRRAEVG